MALPSCKRCGKENPQRMHGLMSLWFASLIELEADLGYFYLCPSCHDEIIVPELERIQNRILELHPAAQRALDEVDLAESAPEARPGEEPGEGSSAPDSTETPSSDDGASRPPD